MPSPILLNEDQLIIRHGLCVFRENERSRSSPARETARTLGPAGIGSGQRPDDSSSLSSSVAMRTSSRRRDDRFAVRRDFWGRRREPARAVG